MTAQTTASQRRFTGRSPDDADAPQSAEDRRPGDVPYYVAASCGDCGQPLVPAGQAKNTDPATWWHDEFVCTRCEAGVVLDWPLFGEDAP